MNLVKIWATNSEYASGSVGNRPNKTAFTQFDANVPSPCTATDPVFIFSHDKDPTTYNLFYVPHMGKRFYNVVSVVYREGGLYEYHCHVNLLLSMVRAWKTHKHNNVHNRVLLEHTNVSAFLTGDDVTESYDAKLYPVKRREYHLDTKDFKTKTLDTHTNKQTVYFPHQNTYMFTNNPTSNNRAVIIGFVSQTGGYSVSVCKDSTLATIINKLCSTSISGITDSSLAKYYGNPTECIKMCKVLPCRWQDIVDFATAQGLAAQTTLTMGYYQISGLSDCYYVPTNNPQMCVRFAHYFYLPCHPQYNRNGITDKIINRSPHSQPFISIPPFGTIEIDTTGLDWDLSYYTSAATFSAPFNAVLLIEIDIMSGEGTLYYKLYRGTGSPDWEYDWLDSERWVMAAKANVCMDMPIMALVQNIGTIRAAQLGLAQLDTKRNMPDAQLNRIITSAVSSLWSAMESTPNLTQDEWSARYANTGNSFFNALKVVDANSSIPVLNALTNPTAKAPVNNDPLAQGIRNVGKTAGNMFSRAVSAMDTAFNFTQETNHYKTQLSDAVNYPQVSITGNASGSLSYMNTQTGVCDLYVVYDEFLIQPYNKADVGHECYKTLAYIHDLSTPNPAPVNRCSIITEPCYVRGADEGQLTDAEKTELRTILQTGFSFYDNDDDWTAI